jgi:hypothetical protein
MLPDARLATDRLQNTAASIAPAITGAPSRDLIRSPAAAHVARHAAASGLFLFHYEHRAQLDLPEEWLPEGADELGAPPHWLGGVLPERKYQSFRHDQALGSMHPGHRGKWSTHELCHGLAGHAWAPDATPFFLATAGRLAELLPVALYYFFDEAFLRRCPDHAGRGALFRSFCAACEEQAGFDGEAPGRSFVEEGLRFVDRELAEVARSRRLGRPTSHRFATLDLASDGVAYALAHGPRLRSEAFARWTERFGGRSPDLDALEARVLAVTEGVLGGELDPLPGGPSGLRWIAEDIGWRLGTVWSETDGDAARGLDAIMDQLAMDTHKGDPEAVTKALAAYRALYEEFELLPPDELEAVGYPLATPWAGTVGEGLESLGSANIGDVGAFAAFDLTHPERRPLADRWATWLPAGSDKDLARYQAAVACARGEIALPGGASTVRLARGARVEVFECDVVALAEGRTDGEGPTALGFVRSGEGELILVELDPAAATALGRLGDGATSPLPEGDTGALLELGLLVPAAYTERR